MSNKAEKRGLVPKLRFLEFREAGEWEKKKIGKALIEQARPIEMDDEEEYSLVTVKRRYGGVVSRGVFKGKSIKVKTQFLLHENDFLISKRQIVHCACGVIPKALAGSIVSNEYSVLRARDGFDVSFFDYFSQQPTLSQSFLRCSIGIVIEKMLFKLNDWLKEEFLFPLIHEQQKIADCLASLDELLTLEAQKLDTLKTHKKGLMQQLFPAEGETLPKLRFSEFRDTGEWSSTTFGAAATFINGKAYKQEELLDRGKYRVLRVGNFFTNKEWYFSDLELEEDKYCDRGDLLYAWSASFGPRIWVGEKVIYHYHIWKVVEANGIDKQFLFVLLDYETERMKAESSNGLGLLHITKGAIEGWGCCIPKEKEQQKIADCLASLDDLIIAQTQKLAALKIHKKGLMQQLFPALGEALA